MSMPFVMNLACVNMRMTLNEALVAATLNAAGNLSCFSLTLFIFVAASINRSTTHGSLEVGKKADMVVLDTDNWEHLIYELIDPPIEAVIKEGNEVFSKRHVLQTLF